MQKSILVFILFLLLMFAIPSKSAMDESPLNYDILIEEALIHPPQELSITETRFYPEIAIVKPLFTASAYSRYYTFYRCYTRNTCDSSDAPDYFVEPPRNSWATSAGASSFLNKLKQLGYPSSKIHIITDIDVHKNNLYDEDGFPLYSSIVYVHNEYVTMNQYQNTVQYIKNGGNAIVLNGNAFFGEIDYDEKSNKVIMVDAHGFTFDGKDGVFSSTYRRFIQGIDNFEHADWFGSRYCAFNLGSTNGAIFNVANTNPHPLAKTMVENGITAMAPNYVSHEENCLITPNVHIIADWDTSFHQLNRGIKIYEIFPEGPFGGSLIHFGFFGTDILGSSTSSVLTFIEAVRHQSGRLAMPWIRYPTDGSVLKNDIVIDFTPGYKTKVYINGSYLPNLNRLNFLRLSDGLYNLTVEFNTGGSWVQKTIHFEADNTSPIIIPDIVYDENGSLIRAEFTMDELHENLLSGYIYGSDQDNRQPALQSNGRDPLQLSFSSHSLRNGSYGIRIEAIDTAGNTQIEYYHITAKSPIPNNLSLSKLFRSDFRQINDSHGFIDLGWISENITAIFQISENYGNNWQNISTLTDEMRTYAYLQQNSTGFWYRIAYYEGTEFLEFYRDIRSFYWDQEIIHPHSINHALDNEMMAFNISMKFPVHRTQNMSLSLHNSSGYELDNITLNVSTDFVILYSEQVSGEFLLKITDNLRSTTVKHNILINQSIDNEMIENHFEVASGLFEIDHHNRLSFDRIEVSSPLENTTLYPGNSLEVLLINGRNIFVNIQFFQNGVIIRNDFIKFTDELLDPFSVFQETGYEEDSDRFKLFFSIFANTEWTLVVTVNQIQNTKQLSNSHSISMNIPKGYGYFSSLNLTINYYSPSLNCTLNHVYSFEPPYSYVELTNQDADINPSSSRIIETGEVKPELPIITSIGIVILVIIMSFAASRKWSNQRGNDST